MNVSSLLLPFLVIFSSTSILTTATVEEEHVGCFSSDFVESYPYYKIKTATGWRQGVEACAHRLTTHLAVTPDHSSPGDYTFFCGNNLLENSKSMKRSKCQHCGDKFCGGSGSVSIYKLRDATPLSVLLAISGTAVLKVTEEDDLPVLDTIFQLNTKMWEMDYHYVEDAIWFTYQNNTYTSVYDVGSSQYSTPRKISTCKYNNLSPTFDWVKNSLYYGCSNERKIYELDLEGNVVKTYDLKIDRNIRSLAIDPYKKLAFVFTWGNKTFSYSFENDTLKEFEYGNLNLTQKVMCIDFREQNLYAIGELEGETDKVLIRVDYLSTKAEILYKGPELFNVWSMDYFNGTIVWSNIRASDSSDIAYKCTLTPNCQKEDLREIYNDEKQSITNVKIYHPLKQTPDTQNLCDLLKCSHSCSRLSLFEARCECPSTLGLKADNSGCSALSTKGALKEDHLGCFSSSFAESHPYYRIKLSLTWSQGVRACNHRLTTHMAVTSDPSSPGEYVFFCGNDLQENSQSVDESQCERCIDNSARFCGGSNTVSMYQLRDATPFSVLVAASGREVIQVTEEDGRLVENSVMPLNTKMWDMDYSYAEDEIWFSYHNVTYRSFFNPVTSKYMSPRTVPFFCASDNRSPNFDWEKNRVYYGCASNRKIYELDYNGNVMEIYEPKIYRGIRTISVDPYRRLAFISMWSNKLFSYSLETGTLKEFVKYGGRLSLKMEDVCIDHHKQILYVSGVLEGEKDKVLVKVNYRNTEATVIYKGPELFDVWSMDYFNETIVWANGSKNSSDIVYKCTLTPECRKEDLKEIYKESDKSITNVKIYHPLKQTPDTQGLCDQIKCSRYCTRVSLFKAKC